MNRGLAVALVGSLGVHGLAVELISRGLSPSDNREALTAYSVRIKMTAQSADDSLSTAESIQTTNLQEAESKNIVSESAEEFAEVPKHPLPIRKPSSQTVLQKPAARFAETPVKPSKPVEPQRELAETTVHIDPPAPHKQASKQNLVDSLHKVVASTQTVKHTSHQAGGRSTPAAELLRLIHNAVSQQKHYPPRARRRGWQGRPVVHFKLHPSGVINQISLVSNSPYSVLDKAALRAVSAASPIAGVGQYLQQPLMMKLGLRFRLE